MQPLKVLKLRNLNTLLPQPDTAILYGNINLKVCLLNHLNIKCIENTLIFKRALSYPIWPLVSPEIFPWTENITLHYLPSRTCSTFPGSSVISLCIYSPLFPIIPHYFTIIDHERTLSPHTYGHKKHTRIACPEK